MLLMTLHNMIFLRLLDKENGEVVAVGEAIRSLCFIFFFQLQVR